MSFPEKGWLEVAEGFVRTLLVVADDPLVDIFAGFGDRGECVGIEHLIAEAAVEPFDVAVCIGRPGWIWCDRMSCRSHQAISLAEMSSGPLSIRICRGSGWLSLRRIRRRPMKAAALLI